MEEEKICSLCEEPIEDEEYKELGDGSIVCNACFEEECKQCEVCKNYYSESDMQVLEDGKETLVCADCYESNTEECAMCGGRFLEDDMTNWGDVCICPGCLEEQCPSFVQEEVEKDTQEAYDAFCKKYVGKRVVDQAPGNIEFDTTVGDESPICYSISVTIDENGIISEISRLEASMMLSDWERGSDWRPYPIRSEDYDFWAGDLLDDNLEFDEEENVEDDDTEEDE